MSPLTKAIAAVSGGIVITSFLLLFLLAGTMEESSDNKVFIQGAVRLSQFKDEPVQEEEVFSTSETPQVKALDKVSPTMETTLDQPSMDLEMPSVDFEIASEMAGTIPMAGLESLAAMSSMGSISGGALTLGEVDEMPRAVYAPQPLYPSAEKALGIEKEVIVRIRLRKDGSVGRVEPIGQTKETAVFHKAAMDAVLQWRFIPCRKGGKAVVCIADQPVGFSLN